MRYIVFALMLFAMPAWAAPRTVEVEQFGKGLFFVPTNSAPKQFIVLLSPSYGWDASASGVAAELADEGAAVLGLDVKTYYEGRAASKDECIYPSGLIEDEAQNLQKDFKDSEYMRPVIIGLGDSGALATMTMLQTLTNTYTGAIAPQFCQNVPSPKPLCLGERLTRQGNDYRPKSLSAIQGEKLDLAINPACANGRKAWPAGTPAVDTLDFIKASLKAEKQAEVSTAAIAGLTDLPLAYLPGQSNNDWLIVFISGDGGWRDIDRQIGTTLQQDGFSVIGIDSLRYFWKQKTPAQTAADIDHIINEALPAWHKTKVAIVGYSFGADVMPFVLPLMKTADKVKHTSFIGLSSDAGFEITVSSFLGKGEDDYDTLAAFKKLSPIPALCIYGDDEVTDDETICPKLTQPWVQKAAFAGGHHYDGAYKKLAQTIIDSMNKTQ